MMMMLEVTKVKHLFVKIWVFVVVSKDLQLLETSTPTAEAILAVGKENQRMSVTSYYLFEVI